jgi:membrane-associated phospholipid phosphatase
MPSNPTRATITRRSTLAVTLAATAAIGAASLTGTARAAEPAASPLAASKSALSKPAAANVVVEWNRTLLSLVQTPGAQPATIQPTRDFAIMSAAVYDAVDAIDADHPQYLLHLKAGHGASQDAAATQAAHDVLTALFPKFTGSLDQELNTDLAAVPAGAARSEGTRVGAQAAADLLKIRATDGSATPPPPYRSTGAAGDYRPTPPGFAAPVFTHWGAVTPFVLRRGAQFRPPPPPALSSPAYAAAVNEVKSLGRDTSSTRSAEQTTIGKFWAAPIQNYWNAIAEQVAVARHDDTDTSARTFALLDLGIADATIALYDAKYTYRLWRPISAIRLADTDGNPLTSADPNWTPLATTPADPSYPGAHSTLSAAAATVLTALYGDEVSFTVTSPTLTGVTRSFDNFHAAATEAGLSRIYAGIHTRIDHEAGLTLGSQIGRYTLQRALSHEHD